MKNIIITLLSVLALSIAFTGCGDSAGSISSSETTDNAANTVEISVGEDEVAVEATAPKTPYNISSALGTPPGLPAK